MSDTDTKSASGPLTYRSFACTPDHAVQCAYLLTLAEAEYERDPASNAAEIIELYARGDVSMDEAIDALQPPVRASLAGAEQERDQAIAMAEAAAEFAKADGAEITAWRTRALRAEAERDAASARAEKAELLHGDTKQALQNEMVAHGRTIIRADKAEAALAARPACDPADPCAFAQDLASENRTLDGLLAEATERAKDAEARAERMRAALASIRDLTPYAANTVSADGHHETTASIARAALAEQEAGK